MSFSRQRAPGLWTFDSVVLSAEFEYFDESISNAIDGAGGGAYSLTAPLILGSGDPGAFLQIDLFAGFTAAVEMGSTLFVGGDVALNGNVTLSNVAVNFAVYPSAAFHNVAQFDADVTMGGGLHLTDVASDFITQTGAYFHNVAHFYSTVQFDDDVTYVGDVTLNGLTVFGGVASFNDQANFNGTTHFGGTVTLGVPLAFSASGRVPQRQVFGGDANLVIGPASATHVIILFGLTADRDYKISDAGAIDGDRMRFTCTDPTYQINVKSPSGGLLATIKAASGASTWCDVERMNGSWVSALPGPQP